MAEWNFHIHDDAEYAGIIDVASGQGETLLRIGGQTGPPGEVDVERVKAFADHCRRLDSLRSQLRVEVDRDRAAAARAPSIATEQLLRERANRLSALLRESGGTS